MATNHKSPVTLALQPGDEILQINIGQSGAVPRQNTGGQGIQNEAQAFAVGQWVISLGTAVVNAVFSFGAKLEVIGTSTLQPFLQTPLGVGGVVYGILGLVFTIVEGGSTSDILSGVGSVIGPVPAACKFLLPISWTNPEELDATGVALGAIDMVCDFASGGLAAASAMTASEKSLRRLRRT